MGRKRMVAVAHYGPLGDSRVQVKILGGPPPSPDTTKTPMPSPETRASPSSAGTLLSTVMLLAIIVTTTWLRTGVAHDIVRPLSNVAEIPASPARSGVELLAGQVRG